MLSHHCTDCDRTQLIFPSQVSGIVNDERGIVLSFRCWCGSEQVTITGNATRRTRPVAAA